MTGQANSPQPRGNSAQPNTAAARGDADDSVGMVANSPESTTGGRVRYVTNNDRNLWSAEKLDGVDVYNDQNKKIGAIEDVLVDRNGQVKAVVIGVGGFLGIGQHDVAVSFDSLQWQMRNPSEDTAAVNGSVAQTTGANSNSAATNNMNAGANGNANRDAPARAILPGATEKKLKSAPEFKYAH